MSTGGSNTVGVPSGNNYPFQTQNTSVVPPGGPPQGSNYQVPQNPSTAGGNAQQLFTGGLSPTQPQSPTGPSQQNSLYRIEPANGMAQGGSVMRPAAHHPHRHMAQGLASLGRGPDDQLVHMSGREVQGLHALAQAHGKTLTTNPDTGLLEAGWLDSILPTLGGVALSFIPGMQPLGAAAIMAAEEGIRQKSWKAGLMGGLGAWGGAGIAGGLTKAGVAAGEEAAKAGTSAALDTASGAAAKTAGAAALDAGANTAAAGAADTSALSAGASNLASSMAMPTANIPATFAGNAATAGQGLGSLANSGAARTAFMGNVGKLGLGAAAAPAINEAMKPADPIATPIEKNYRYIPGRGSSSLYSPGIANPDTAKYGYTPVGESAFIGQHFNPGQYQQVDAQGNPVPGTSATSYVPGMASGGVPQPAAKDASAAAYYQNLLNGPAQTAPMNVPPPTEMNSYLQHLDQMVKSPPPMQAPPVATPPTTPTPTTPTSGIQGGMSGAGNLGQSGGLGQFGSLQQYLQGKHPQGPAINPYYPNYHPDNSSFYAPYTPDPASAAAGMPMGGFSGLGSLQTYAAGGRMLKGPGDGMSDSIPAQINSPGALPQQAALATDEFVVPADVVSHLGNGSSEAGAKHLYAMMDRIRKARTGSTKQGTQIDANKYLPS